MVVGIIPNFFVEIGIEILVYIYVYTVIVFLVHITLLLDNILELRYITVPSLK
jgi:hypothetical protein